MAPLSRIFAFQAYRNTQPRLILSPDSQRSRPPQSHRGGAEKSLFFNTLTIRAGVFISTLLIAGIPITASAGILSFVAGLISGNEESKKEVIPQNSQTISLLQGALNLDPNPAKGGGDITIVGGSALLPDAGPSGTAADIGEGSAASDQISLYVVRKGDTVSGIAKLFGVSVNTIMWANDLKRGAVVGVGQTLIILPVSGIQHTVVKGDTIASIAKKYKGDADEIVSFNGLEVGSPLALGETILIPDGEETLAPALSSSGTRIVRGVTNVPVYSGFYMRPIEGGRRTQGLHGYNGIDLAAPIGTPVYASATGDVIISRSGAWNGGYGNYIVIQHSNGTQTLYAHNSRNLVVSGEHVVQGQAIGLVGNTGKSTGAHVHFEIRGAKNPF